MYTHYPTTTKCLLAHGAMVVMLLLTSSKPTTDTKHHVTATPPGRRRLEGDPPASSSVDSNKPPTQESINRINAAEDLAATNAQARSRTCLQRHPKCGNHAPKWGLHRCTQCDAAEELRDWHQRIGQVWLSWTCTDCKYTTKDPVKAYRFACQNCSKRRPDVDNPILALDQGDFGPARPRTPEEKDLWQRAAKLRGEMFRQGLTEPPAAKPIISDTMTEKETDRPHATMLAPKKEQQLPKAAREAMFLRQLEGNLKLQCRNLCATVQSYEGPMSEFKYKHRDCLVMYQRACSELKNLCGEARMKKIDKEATAEFKLDLQENDEERSKAFQIVFPDPKPSGDATC